MKRVLKQILKKNKLIKFRHAFLTHKFQGRSEIFHFQRGVVRSPLFELNETRVESEKLLSEMFLTQSPVKTVKSSISENYDKS